MKTNNVLTDDMFNAIITIMKERKETAEVKAVIQSYSFCHREDVEERLGKKLLNLNKMAKEEGRPFLTKKLSNPEVVTLGYNFFDAMNAFIAENIVDYNTD